MSTIHSKGRYNMAPRVIIYARDGCDERPEISDADGRVDYGDGVTEPIYHKSHMPVEWQTEPVPGCEGYFFAGSEDDQHRRETLGGTK